MTRRLFRVYCLETGRLFWSPDCKPCKPFLSPAEAEAVLCDPALRHKRIAVVEYVRHPVEPDCWLPLVVLRNLPKGK